jgi:hypothetical protein
VCKSYKGKQRDTATHFAWKFLRAELHTKPLYYALFSSKWQMCENIWASVWEKGAYDIMS